MNWILDFACVIIYSSTLIDTCLWGGGHLFVIKGYTAVRFLEPTFLQTDAIIPEE